MSAPTKAVFLSYASEDAEPARRICAAMRAAGLEVWFDADELRGGDAWDGKIRRQIRECALFVPVISAHTEERPEGYFRLEWKLAVDRSHMISDDRAFLLPVALGGVAQETARVPDRFREVQWTRPADEAGLRLFAVWASSLLAGTARPAATAATPPANAPGRRGETTSIAVLPFVNVSHDEENEYFADGLSEELLNVLAGIRGLRVASRTSAFFFKGKATDLRTVAQKLGVATILEGSVRKAGKRVRITTQLIEAATDSNLWSRTYDRELDDIFAVQDDIARSVVTELRQALLGDKAAGATAGAEVKAAAPGRTDNPEAHQLHLQGRFYLDRTGKEETAHAMKYLTRAVELDPGFAQAWAGLATVHYVNAVHRFMPVDDSIERSRAAAERAIALAPDMAEGYICMARLHRYEWKWAEASAAIEKAFSLAPGSGVVLRVAAQQAAFLGNLDKAIEYLRTAVSMDPLSYAAHINLGGRCLTAGLLEEAEREVRVALDLNPTAPQAHFILGLVRLLRGDPQGMLEAVQAERLPHLRVFAAALAHHSLGEREMADQALEQLIREHSDFSAYEISTVYAWRGDKDKAFEWMDRAIAQRDGGLVGARVDPLYRPLHEDPRWEPFLEKLGLGSAASPHAPIA